MYIVVPSMHVQSNIRTSNFPYICYTVYHARGHKDRVRVWMPLWLEPWQWIMTGELKSSVVSCRLSDFVPAFLCLSVYIGTLICYYIQRGHHSLSVYIASQLTYQLRQKTQHGKYHSTLDFMNNSPMIVSYFVFSTQETRLTFSVGNRTCQNYEGTTFRRNRGQSAVCLWHKSSLLEYFWCDISNAANVNPHHLMSRVVWTGIWTWKLCLVSNSALWARLGL